MNTLNIGAHKIRFSKGKLFLDEVQIAGEGIIPDKEVVFEFHTEKKDEGREPKDPSILEVNVHDSVTGKDKGPGQRE